jgi:hypothetical protein
MDHLTWKAVVRQGTYEIDHATLAARFIRAKPGAATETIEHPHTNLEEAQRFCEQHWRVLVRDRSDTSSRRRAMDRKQSR